MNIKELKELISNLPDDMEIYCQNYSPAGYVTDVMQLNVVTVDIPEEHLSFPVANKKCLIIGAN